MLLGGNALSGTVALLAVVHCSINLDQHRVVNITAKSLFDCCEISVQSVAGELDAIRQTVGKVVHKDPSGNAITRSDDPTWNQFGIGIDSSPGPAVPSKRVFRGDLRRHVLLFCVA